MKMLLAISVFALLALSVEDGYEYECFDINTQNGADLYMEGKTFTGTGRVCCGVTSNGKRRCDYENQWSIYQGHPRYCNIYETPEQAFNRNHDLCCDSPFIDNCGKCKAYYIWDFESVESMTQDIPLESWINNTDWRDDYYNLEQEDPLAREHYPAGYVNAILRDQNNPPVCVYVRNSGGHVLEVKVEPEAAGSTVCIGDSLDDLADKTNPGFTTTCDTAQLTTCIQDGTLETTFEYKSGPNAGAQTITAARGFTFQISCEYGCAEQSDLPLWFRVRFSTEGYQDRVNTDAFTNPEMFCEYVNRDYPGWDLFPTDIELVIPDLGDSDDSSSATLSFFMTLLVVICFLI